MLHQYFPLCSANLGNNPFLKHDKRHLKNETFLSTITFYLGKKNNNKYGRIK
jgi:hypothetical protein